MEAKDRWDSHGKTSTYDFAVKSEEWDSVQVVQSGFDAINFDTFEICCGNFKKKVDFVAEGGCDTLWFDQWIRDTSSPCYDLTASQTKTWPKCEW